MKILILGHGEHGKDHAAEYLCKKTGMTALSSSRAALDVVYPVVGLVTGEWDKEKMYEARRNNRELWYRLICLYCDADKAALAKLITAKAEAFGTAWGRTMNKALKNGLTERFTFHDIKAKGVTDDSEGWAGHKSERMRDIYERKARLKRATK